MVNEDAKNRKKNLSMAWIDYKKAFDSVPHDWIIRCLELYNIDKKLVLFLQHSMTLWKTSLIINHREGIERSPSIKIQRGIFQGDSLSPLLFCISLFPLTELINKHKYGYDCYNKRFNHLFYMDDLKIFAKNDKELSELVKIVKTFSDTIKMNFNTNKCAKVTMKKGRYFSSNNLNVDTGTSIKELDQLENYKYLGIVENCGISHKVMKQNIKKEYIRRVRLVLKTQLNAKNKITAVNSLAVPVASYSFTIVNWTAHEIKQLDIKTRKLLTINRAHHPKADVERLYIKRINGGRGLLQIEAESKIATIGMSEYLKQNNDWMMQCVKIHEDSKPLLTSVTRKATKYTNMIKYEVPPLSSNGNPTAKAKLLKKIAKNALLSQFAENWKQKQLHGQFANRIEQADVDKKKTLEWLKSSSLKPETEGFILAAQDQSLKTKNYEKHVMKATGDDKCRYCHEKQETIDHLVSGCPVLAKSEYILRHNKVAQHLHWQICKHYNIKVNDKWYEHETPPVTESEHATIMWDFAIQTDRTIKANRPDIVVRDKKLQTVLIIDVAIPTDRNTSVKTFEKLSKYKDLDIELAKSWKCETKTIPIVIGALGVINKTTEKYLDEVPGRSSIKELQKTTLLGTARILRKALSLNA